MEAEADDSAPVAPEQEAAPQHAAPQHAVLQHAALPLPDPFPDYLPCPACGEPEVEVWCYERWVQCHQCGAVFFHPQASECKLCPQHGSPKIKGTA